MKHHMTNMVAVGGSLLLSFLSDLLHFAVRSAVTVSWSTSWAAVLYTSRVISLCNFYVCFWSIIFCKVEIHIQLIQLSCFISFLKGAAFVCFRENLLLRHFFCPAYFKRLSVRSSCKSLKFVLHIYISDLPITTTVMTKITHIYVCMCVCSEAQIFSFFLYLSFLRFFRL